MGQPHNPFTSPAGVGEAREPNPRPRDLEGCLVAYAPKEFTPAGAPGNEKGVGGSDPRDRVTADLIVLEVPNAPRGPFQPYAGMIAYGGSPDYEKDPVPHYLAVAAPARFESVWVSNSNMVRFALAPGKQPKVGELILGRIVRSDIGNKPFNLERVDGTPDMDKAVAIYTALQLGQATFTSPQPIPGAPIPVKAQAAPTAPAMPPGSVNYGFAPSPMPPTPTAWMGSAPPAPPTPPTAPAPPVPPQFPAQVPVPPALANAFPGTTAIPQPPAPPAPPVPPAPAQLPAHLVRAGWTPQTWADLTTEQQSQVLAHTPLS
jgi:hypothetical protein